MDDEGDDKFQQLLPYYGRVVTFFRALGFPREDARDLTQDTFLRVSQYVHEYRGEARWSYLQTIARHVATNHLRDAHAQKRTGVMESEDALAGVADEKVQPADKAMEAREASDWLHRAVDRLDANQRSCMRLLLAGLSYGEISRALALSDSAVKSRLNQARKRLQMMVGDGLEDLGDEP
jgi:RNA polymerase sigma factor (sigma-70 family)